jgi:predicted GNAT family acetyltransferase
MNMLRVDFESDPKKFLARAGEFLHRHEAEHNLMLSLCEAAQKANTGIQFATLSSDDGIVMASAQTPGRNLVLSRAEQDGIETLAEKLAEHKTVFPGVVGPADVTAAFSNAWTKATGQKFDEYMDQIIYSLTKVAPSELVEGRMRAAEEKDLPHIHNWLVAFGAESHLPKSEQLAGAAVTKMASERIAAGRIFVWDVDGKTVAQAGISGTKDVARVSLVYTPEDMRGKGYARSLVTTLSQKQLNDGKKMCCLYADARNPVSNSIYRKIGYEFVGRSSLYVRGAE